MGKGEQVVKSGGSEVSAEVSAMQSYHRLTCEGARLAYPALLPASSELNVVIAIIMGGCFGVD